MLLRASKPSKGKVTPKILRIEKPPINKGLGRQILTQVYMHTACETLMLARCLCT